MHLSQAKLLQISSPIGNSSGQSGIQTGLNQFVSSFDIYENLHLLNSFFKFEKKEKVTVRKI